MRGLTKWPRQAVYYESAFRCVRVVIQDCVCVVIHASVCSDSVLVEVTRLRKDFPKSDITDFTKSIESQ